MSNSPFQESEYNKWVEDCAAHGTELPSMIHVDQKQKDIHDLLYYQFSSEDIDKVLNSLFVSLFRTNSGKKREKNLYLMS